MSNRESSPSYYLESRLDLLLSNPVLWLRSLAASLCWDTPAEVEASARLLEELIRIPPIAGVQFPDHELRLMYEKGWIRSIPDVVPNINFAPQEPKVMGLVASEFASYVVPIKVAQSTQWHIDPLLPFKLPAIQEVLSTFTRCLAVPSVVPERYQFQITTPLRALLAEMESHGHSMNLAALVAILVHIETKRHAAFENCCVLGTLTTDGNIVRSGYAKEKAEAFLREFASGSLLIRAGDCKISAQYSHHFECVWTVHNLRELIREFQGIAFLETLTQESPLSPPEMRSAIGRLEQLVYHNRNYRIAVDLADRLAKCPQSPTVPFEAKHRLLSLVSEVHRHTGSVDVASSTAKEMSDLLRNTGGGTSYDQIAGSDVAHAASIFDLACFDEIIERLSPWLQRIDADPLIFRPMTRIIIFNTIGRAWSALGRKDGLHLFERSMELQRSFFPDDVSRTENYLIYGAIKLGELELADQKIGEESDWHAYSPISRWMRAFLKAELARAKGQRWEVDWMDSPDDVDTGWGSPFAYYSLATARQAGRSKSDADRRFHQAEMMIEHDINTHQCTSTLDTLLQWVRLARFVYREDMPNIKLSRSRLEDRVSAFPDQHFQDFHRSLLRQFDGDSKRSMIDHVMNRLALI